jgi:hypothetical protein
MKSGAGWASPEPVKLEGKRAVFSGYGVSLNNTPSA